VLAGRRPLDAFSFPSDIRCTQVAFSVVAIAFYPMLAWLLVPFTVLVAIQGGPRPALPERRARRRGSRALIAGGSPRFDRSRAIIASRHGAICMSNVLVRSAVAVLISRGLAIGTGFLIVPVWDGRYFAGLSGSPSTTLGISVCSAVGLALAHRGGSRR